MEKSTVYIGTYTSRGGPGICQATFDSQARTLRVDNIYNVENPSYLAMNPQGTRLYAVIETAEFGNAHGGGVISYAVEADGSLTLLNTRPAGGGSPCHLSVSPNGRHLFVANYKEGTTMVFPLAQDGSIREDSHLVVHEGSGPNKARQEGPHAHFALLTPDASHLCVVDLGLDAVKLYPYNEHTGISTRDVLTIPAVTPGSGPRHLVFSQDGRYLYLVCEMGNMIDTYAYLGNGAVRHLQSVPTLPADFTGESTCAAIRLSADGKSVYASNRGHDSIATYDIGPDGLLSLRGISPTGGKTPRDLQPSGDGRFLFAGHQDGGGITLMEVGAHNVPEFTGIRYDIESSVCIINKP